MLRLRLYQDSDASTILSWVQSEKEFYQWTAGKLGVYPISEKEFSQVKSQTPFVAFDETGLVGFFILRDPNGTTDELRFGFVIVDPKKRGRGYGKEILRLGLTFIFDVYRARRASLGVFENNPAAYSCYKSAGFVDLGSELVYTYRVMGEDWRCRELAIDESAYRRTAGA